MLRYSYLSSNVEVSREYLRQTQDYKENEQRDEIPAPMFHHVGQSQCVPYDIDPGADGCVNVERDKVRDADDKRREYPCFVSHITYPRILPRTHHCLRFERSERRGLQ